MFEPHPHGVLAMDLSPDAMFLVTLSVVDGLEKRQHIRHALPLVPSFFTTSDPPFLRTRALLFYELVPSFFTNSCPPFFRTRPLLIYELVPSFFMNSCPPYLRTRTLLFIAASGSGPQTKRRPYTPLKYQATIHRSDLRIVITHGSYNRETLRWF